MGMARLCVVRLSGAGSSLFSRLALVVPIDEDHVRVVKTDADDTCSLAEVRMVEETNVQVLDAKAHVLAAAEREHAALRAQVSGYAAVRPPRACVSVPHSVLCCASHRMSLCPAHSCLPPSSRTSKRYGRGSEPK